MRSAKRRRAASSAEMRARGPSLPVLLATMLLLAGCVGQGEEPPVSPAEDDGVEPAPGPGPGPGTTTNGTGSGASSGSTPPSGNSTAPPDVPPGSPVPEEPLPAGVALRATCDGALVEEPTATFGQDESFGRLTWAALKQGGRLAVAWEAAAEGVGTLELSVDGGEWRSYSDLLPKTAHAFVVDVSLGQVACIRVKDDAGAASPTHAVRLANQRHAYDAATGSYTLNLLVLANEGSDAATLEAGMRRYGELLHDATDGHVRAGATIVLYGDYELHNSGWVTCYIAGAPGPTCNRVHDVIFTLDAAPQGAASTYRDGVEDPDAAIWMNWYWQAPPHSPLIMMDDVGSVLTHEVGHYVFGMMDLYSAAGVGEDCYDSASSISIMGGNRDATEYDDAAHPCPNASAIADYTPSWTFLRERFPTIPERSAIDAGPEGDGGGHVVAAFSFL